MPRIYFILFFLSAINVFGQRNFFTADKVLLNCDSVNIIFDDKDSLTIKQKLYWAVSSDSIEIKYPPGEMPLSRDKKASDIGG
jgi:hypothetical protein